MFTKKSYICLLVSIFFAVVSCGDDDTNEGEIPVASNPTEETPLDPTTISNSLEIDNATNVTGDAPTPVGSLPFSLDYTTQSGFLLNGVNITFDAPDNYAGAYIQIVSNDGTAAPNYWNVEVNSPFKTPETNQNNTRNRIFSRERNVTEEQEIEVNFSDAVAPGKFCYVICIYDADGNISQPQEVCVEVEAWGGNESLVGIWNYTKQISNGDTTLPGEESDCYEETISCNNNDQFTYESCYSLDAFKLTLNSNGTYEYRSDSTDQDLNYDASIEGCTAVLDPEEASNYTSTGNWAYDEEEGKMTLVEFSYTEVEGDETYSETFENGYLDIDAPVAVNGSSLIVSATDNEGDIPQIVKFYFTKE